jgi:prepilin-type N-terminal cleavage/methylation domain-containing protein
MTSSVVGREPFAPAALRGVQGFTLVELLIVVVLAGLLGAVTLDLFRTQNRLFRDQNRVVEVEQNLRAGLDLMLRELRNAGVQDQLAVYADAPGIAVADSNGVRLKQDLRSDLSSSGSPDGDVTDADEDVEYAFTRADSTLWRRTRGADGDSGLLPVANYVTRLRLTYFNADGDSLAFPIAGAALRDIRRVHIELTGAVPGGPSTAVIESDVAPRNLAY